MIRRLFRKFVPERLRIRLIMLKMQFKSLGMTGDRFYCNCCRKSFSRFLSFGNIPRENACCPWCHSLERTRVLLAYLERETNLFRIERKVLHFAPEWIIRKRFRKSGNRRGYYSADINPALADHVADIMQIPFPEDYFDCVICSHVLGHVPDEKKAVSEMYRVLKPGGEALVMTVIDPENPGTYENPALTTPEERLSAYGEADLLRLHGKDFAERLAAEGITVEVIDYRTRLTPSENRRMSTGDGHRELIFRCLKNSQVSC
jgi:SAM-dependent methyltransferase